MATFIELKGKDGFATLVNIDTIIFLRPADTGKDINGKTVIRCVSGEEFIVENTFSEVLKILENCKLVQG